MTMLKSFLLLIAALSLLAEPQVAGQNQYLPPPSESPTALGYNYPKPTVGFPTPPRPPPTSFSPPTGNDNGVLLPQPISSSYGPPTQADHGHDHSHHEPGMPFDFQYAVKDDQYGNDYSHNAVSDGDVVRGEYRVQLPDGRLQIVRYTADWATGFHADVQYEGEPQYTNIPAGGSAPGDSYSPSALKGGRRPGGSY